MLGTPEIILIALIVLLLFGGKKIPEMMKGLGKGVKSFKDGMNGKEDDTKKDSSSDKDEKSEK
jgi:sec-independent protein translocase protein TatA